MAHSDILLDRSHSARLMPSREQQRLRHILMAIGGIVLVFLVFKYLQISQQTEFVEAARAGNVPAVRAALEGGLPGMDANAAMEAAIEAGRGNVVRLLLNKQTDPTPGLETAARQGNADILRLLMERGGNIQGERGDHLLRLAAQSGSKDCVHLLLRYGASCSAVNPFDDAMAPLHYAARSGQPGVVKVLLDRGANVRDRTETGRTALMLAAVWNEPTACKYLMEKGAEINARDIKGQTALMQAAVVGNYQTLTYLLSCGASTKIKDNSGRTALDHAIETGDPKILNLLRRAGAK
jgi:uncharacterized protein